MGSRWKGHVTRHPLLGAVELTLAWHVVLVLFAEVILPPLAPSWFPDLGAAVVNAICFAGVWCVLVAACVGRRHARPGAALVAGRAHAARRVFVRRRGP
ncbi:hypothetical protein [Streptomyces sp. Rer75]|uniref:hypothetical protein n=1 Tax=Streptomyces sp. Rer75 TaxID=2750011 RepID=UPI00211EA897|nr:hypothetical protein [Streptomyces sp. Rer75]